MTITLKERYKIIFLKENGLSLREIADVIGCSKATVALWVKRNKQTGDVQRQCGSGRGRCTDEEMDAKLIEAQKADQHASLKKIRAQVEGAPSLGTVQRRLREAGFVVRNSRERDDRGGAKRQVRVMKTKKPVGAK